MDGSYKEAEVRAIVEGLSIVKKRKFSNVIVETDCEAVLELIEGHMKSEICKSDIDNIKKMMKETNSLMIQVRRKGNECANQLASKAHREERNYILYTKPYKELIPYLLEYTIWL